MNTFVMLNVQRDVYILVSIMECYDKFTRLATAGKRIYAIVSEKMIMHFNMIIPAYSFAHC